MKVVKLTIRNFLSIKEVTASLDKKGLVLIQGENRADTSQDSNGAGKSSFADAINWCLYGSTARGESGDRVVNRTAKNNTQVEVVVKEGDTQYAITRYRKHKKMKNRLTLCILSETGAVSDVTKGTDKLTQEMIDKVLGCSQEVFCAAIYSGQDNMPSLPDMTDKNLKSLIEESAGITQLDEAYKIAKARLNSVTSEMESTVTLVNHKTESLNDRRIDLEELKEKSGSFDASKKSEVARLKKEAKEAVSNLKAKSETLAEIMPICTSAIEELEELNEKIQNADKHKKQIDALRLEATKTQRSVDSINSSIESVVAKVKSNVAKVKTLRSQEATVCDGCNRPHDQTSTKFEIEKILKAIEDSKISISDLKSSRETQQGNALSLSDSLKALEADTIDVLDLMNARDDLKSIISDAENQALTIKSRRLAIENMQQTIKDTEAQQNEFAELVKTRSKANKVIEKELDEAEAKLKTFTDRERVAKEVVRVYSPSGVRAYILDTVTPFLNDRTSHYLSALTDGNIEAVWNTLTMSAKKELMEKFSITVTSKTGSDNFKGLSGGEKRKVRLATSMALQDLVATRASKPIDLFIADEIDHALDEAGLERLTGILQDKAKERGTVLVISHNSLSDWISNSVTMVKENGYSRMEGIALEG